MGPWLPDIGSNAILDISMKVFLDGINISISEREQVTLLSLMWMGLTHSAEGFKKRLISPKSDSVNQWSSSFNCNSSETRPCWSNLQIVHLPILRNHMSQMLNKNTGFPAGCVSRRTPYKHLPCAWHHPKLLVLAGAWSKVNSPLELMILACAVNSEHGILKPCAAHTAKDWPLTAPGR